MVFNNLQGHFQLIQAIHCIPRHFKGFSSAAAIRLTQSGNHLFVSNRGHDSIAMYRVNKESGKIHYYIWFTPVKNQEISKFLMINT